MPYIIFICLVAASMFIVAIVQLIIKKRALAIPINIAIFIGYALFIFIGADQANGWDGLAWILGGLIALGVHLIVLFVYALAVPHKIVPTHNISRNEPPRSAPFTDPNPTPQPEFVVHSPKTTPPPADQTQHVAPTAKSFDAFFEEDEGGELDFD